MSKTAANEETRDDKKDYRFRNMCVTHRWVNKVLLVSCFENDESDYVLFAQWQYYIVHSTCSSYIHCGDTDLLTHLHCWDWNFNLVIWSQNGIKFDFGDEIFSIHKG